MIDGPYLQVDGLEAAERPLDCAQPLVGTHGLLGIKLGRGHARAHDVQPVEGGLGGDGLGVATVGERGLGDVEHEVLGHLVLRNDLADAKRDRLLALEPALLALRGGDNGGEQGFGGLEQRLAFVRPLGGQALIAAHNQPLARIGIAADFGQVGVVEHRALHRAGAHQLADRGRAQRRDPIEPRRGDLLTDTRFGEHPAVADEHHPLQAKAPAQLLELRSHGGGVGGVALEDLDRDRTPLAVAQQPEHDLQLPSLAITRVAALGQRTAPSLEVRGAQVVEHQGAVAQVALGQTLLDGALALEQPVHRGVELVFVDAVDAEHLGQRVAGGVGGEPPRGGELRAWGEDSGDDKRDGALAFGRGGRGDEALEAQLAQGAEHRGDVAVRARAEDVEGGGEVGDGGAAFEQDSEPFDEGGGPFGEVGQCALADFAGVAIGLAKQDGGWGVAVGDGLDVHGYQ